MKEKDNINVGAEQTEASARPEKKPTGKASPEEKNPSKKKETAKKPVAKKEKMNPLKFLGGWLFKKMARGGADQLQSNADEVNNLNVFPVPDGDTGDNMAMTVESGIAEMENMKSDDLSEVLRALSHGMLLGARGNSGVILSQFFAGIAKGLEDTKEADAKALGRALELGVKQAYSSVMTPTEGTILTVAREAVEYSVSRITKNSTIHSFFADLVKEMHESLDRTPDLLPALKEAGVVDSGAAGLVYIIDGFNRVLNGKQPKVPKNAKTVAKPAPQTAGSFGPDSVMTFGYCTEVLIQLMRSKTNIDAFDVEELKKFLSRIGDSVVAFKTDSIVKIHVHTLAPDKVIEYGRKYGEFLSVKIENMSIQHSQSSVERESEEAAPGEGGAPKKKYGVVAVCNGEGIENLYRELGCDVIVRGGQTHNPSTQDLIDACDKISAEHIFLFPNNGNIFMAAGQAAELYEKATLHVVPSKSIGTGYVALSCLDFENDDALAVFSELEAAVARVTPAYISPAIRDADMNGVHIQTGETIGIIAKDIVLSEPDRKTAAKKLASMLLSEEGKFMLTVFSGADADKEETAELEAHVREEFPDAEIYIIEGGQEIYPYIFVCE